MRSPFRRRAALDEPPPQLRPNVEILRAGPDHFFVSHPASGARFQITARERQLLHLMDGRNELETIRSRFEGRFRGFLSPRALREFVGQLRRCGLLEGGPLEPAAAAAGAPGAAPPVPVPLGRDDPAGRINRFFDVLVLLFGWLLHPLWVPVYLGLSLVGAVELGRDFGRYLEELAGLFLRLPTWLLIPASLSQTILFMNLPRELAIGMAVRRFGGRIRHFEIYLLGGLLPFFGCDPGDSTERMTRRGRFSVLTAGLFAHSTIGALGAIGWAMAPPESGLGIFCELLILPWVVGLFLHANPFVRLDGYKLLCVVTRQPRLQERATAETSAWLARQPSPEALTSRERFWFRAYGIGRHVWMWCLRLVYIVGGTWWLVLRLEGLGALIALSLIAAWYRKPLTGWIMKHDRTRWRLRHGGQRWLRWGLRGGVLLLLLVVGFLPYDREISGECSLVAEAQQGVRAQVRDEIVAIHVDHGQWVEAGAPIAELSGRDVRANLEQKIAELRESEAQLDLVLEGSRHEDIRVAQEQVETSRVKLDFQERELARQESLARENVAREALVDRFRQERDTARNILDAAEENLARVMDGAREQEVTAARARVERSKAALAHAQRQAELLLISAPIAGRIVTPNLRTREGQVAEVGDLIATIVNTRELILEIAADEAAAPLVQAGMPVKARLRGLDGGLVTARVRSVSGVAFADSEFHVNRIRTDREVLFERSMERRNTDSYHFRVYAELEDAGGHEERLLPGMTGYARIVVGEEPLWRAVVRPFVRYFRTEVWSWLP